MDTSDLAKRMKEYENKDRKQLQKKEPVLLRLDGKAFHTFTKGFKKPFDEILVKSMQEAMKYLCENVQGCVFGYTQSDEITLVLVDYDKPETSAWFDYDERKICSIAASITTMAFNKFFTKNAEDFIQDCATDYETKGLCGEGTEEYKLCKTYQNAMNKGAMFDCRCFNLPKDEVVNCIYWRQLDAIRNSKQMVAQANFSQSELQGKTCNMIIDMLKEKGVDWENDIPIHLQRGSGCIKITDSYNDIKYNKMVRRSKWTVNKNIPLFKGEGREYIEDLIML